MRSRTQVGVAAAALVVTGLMVWWAALKVDTPELRRHEDENWQTAAAGDCALMAKALLAFPFAQDAHPPPLLARTNAPGPCDWSRYGLHLGVLTVAQFKASCPDPHGSDCATYAEHILLSRPNYSWLHLRAAVEVDHLYGDLGANGYVCLFHSGLSGWSLESCREAWIS